MTTMAEPCDKCGKLDANKCAECNPIRKEAARLTEEIKALVREKPTAINAYGLKSWEKIEQMIADALTPTAPSKSAVPEDQKYSQGEMEHYANARDRRRVTENDREAAEEAWSRRVGSCNTKQTCMEKVKEDFMAGFTRGLIQARSAQEAK
jgi:hypothetical protein